MTIPITIAVTITVFVLGVGSTMTTIGPWYCDLRRPAWNPPNWAFGPVWTVILGMAAWSGVLAWVHSSGAGERLLVAVLFGVNIILYMLWSPLFFNLRRPDWALIEVPFLWLSIMALMIGLAPLSTLASLLLLPYLLGIT